MTAGTTDADEPRGEPDAAGWLAAPSPCVGVCRYEAPKGRCIACAMKRDDKRDFKRLGAPEAKRRFIVRTVRRLARQGGLMRWLRMYARKCDERGARDMTRTL